MSSDVSNNMEQFNGHKMVAKGNSSMTTAAAKQILADVGPILRAAGFDLLHGFQVGQFNRNIEEKYKLQDFGNPASLGLLVGNSKALWQPFLDVLAASDEIFSHPDPVNAFTERVCEAALKDLNQSFIIHYAHDEGDKLVPMQQLAHLAGLAHLGPALLNIHEIFGPWFALRTVIVIDAPGPLSGPAVNPCRACSRPCVPALAKVLSGDQPPECEAVEADWRNWVAVRDACPEGTGHRYSDDQIRYHYEKDRDYLRGLIKA